MVVDAVTTSTEPSCKTSLDVTAQDWCRRIDNRVPAPETVVSPYKGSPPSDWSLTPPVTTTDPAPVCPLRSCDPVMSVITSATVTDCPEAGAKVMDWLPWMNIPEP